MRLRVTISLAVAFVVALLPGTGRAMSADAPYAAADAAMRTRVSTDQLDGGAQLAMRDDAVLHQATFGDWPKRAPIPIASASKWLTSATLMTFVDADRIDLDGPVAALPPCLRRTEVARHRPPG